MFSDGQESERSGEEKDVVPLKPGRLLETANQKQTEAEENEAEMELKPTENMEETAG